MSTSQRVGRGFHRLGLFLAAIPLLVGILAIGIIGVSKTLLRHQQTQCAHAYIGQRIIIMPDGTPVRFPDDMSDNQIRALILTKFPDLAKTAASEASQPDRPPLDLTKTSNAELLALKQAALEAARARAGGELFPSSMVPASSLFAPDDSTLNLKLTGCSNWDYETMTYGEARDVYGSFIRAIAKFLGIGLAITLAASLALYGVVRAIGWVIGGFAAS